MSIVEGIYGPIVSRFYADTDIGVFLCRFRSPFGIQVGDHLFRCSHAGVGDVYVGELPNLGGFDAGTAKVFELIGPRRSRINAGRDALLEEMGVRTQATGEKLIAWLPYPRVRMDRRPAQIVGVHVDVEQSWGYAEATHIDDVGSLSRRNISFDTSDLAFPYANVENAVQFVGGIDDMSALQQQVKRGRTLSHGEPFHFNRCWYWKAEGRARLPRLTRPPQRVPSSPDMMNPSRETRSSLNTKYLVAICLTLCLTPWLSPTSANEVREEASAKPLVHLLKLHTVNTEGSMIDPGLAAYVERVVLDAEAADADALIFDIDTFGGRVDAATVIRDAIVDADILTIAFINKRAISAGALISLACDRIVMVKGGTIGASTPVTGGGDKASDKYVSVMRAEMRGTAEQTGRDPEIAEAMVDERIFIPELSDEAGQPATLTARQALQYDMVDEMVKSLPELLAIYDLAEAKIVEVEITWAERVVRLLTHPVVTSLLLSVAAFGMIAEVRTPGWGLGGSLAMLALALFFGSHLIVQLAEWQELLLFAVGLGLLFAEIAFIPGFGIAGIAGFLCMLASVLLTRLPEFDFWTVDQVSAVVGQFALSLILGIVGSVILLRALPKVAAFRNLVLAGSTSATEGYVSAPTDQDSDLVGQQGVTVTELRPVGAGMFSGKRLDIIAEGEFIDAETAVVIVAARGSRIVVRATS